MSLSSVGAAMASQIQSNVLEKVNVSLLKTANNQAEQQTAQLLASVAPVVSSSSGSLGQHVDTYA
ncbi:MAG: putative motility protein [Colwellia sp.]|nr:putative motility protein [Colwellia sp.]